ncbi:MAG: RraA family protein [Phycisphaerae bacterium]
MALSGERREELMAAFEDLRVADVRDGMDTMMMHRAGSMSPSIRPVWRTRAFGVARTVRYVPFAGTVPELGPREYWKWVGEYYREVCPYPWIGEIQPGDFAVIDQSGVDAGLMGSANTLSGLRNGVRGYVTNGGVRDTDEIIAQRVPFWSAFCSQSMVQGRLQYDSRDVPVCVGGVTVYPGDVIVADGDGVIVVPQGIALEVARHAHAEHARDKADRRKHYEALEMEPDETVGEGPG